MISPLPGVTDAKPGSAHVPLPGIDAKVLDDEASTSSGHGVTLLSPNLASMLREESGEIPKDSKRPIGLVLKEPTSRETEPNTTMMVTSGYWEEWMT